MLIRALVGGLKSVISKSLTSPSEPHRVTPLSMVFIGGIAGISLVLAEIFLGLSVYKVLRFDCGYSEGLSMLMASLVYLVHMVVSLLILKYRIKKEIHQSVVIKEYKLVKDVVNALIEGYKSK